MIWVLPSPTCTPRAPLASTRYSPPPSSPRIWSARGSGSTLITRPPSLEGQDMTGGRQQAEEPGRRSVPPSVSACPPRASQRRRLKSPPEADMVHAQHGRHLRRGAAFVGDAAAAHLRLLAARRRPEDVV